ncbi:MAG TPA: amidophosphoribosyltransferase [Ruminococcaceae bacterium]|nr:amidophosphoribosyltransferase [Oscillospiraceae bacterium]
MNKGIQEECGVFGVYSKHTSDVAGTAYYALYALQHRGQESCGIAVNDDGIFTHYRDLGLVGEVFTPERLRSLGTGKMAVGHVRSSTSGRVNRANAQPLVIRHIKGTMALVQNGRLVNAASLRESFELSGAIFHSANNAEIIAYTVTKARLSAPSIEKALEKAMYELRGAYSLIIMSPKKLIAARDPFGFRPLCVGETPGGDYIFASETCALDSAGARLIRELRPGEIMIAGENGLTSITTHCGGPAKLCVFEFVYIARPDSIIEGAGVHEARLRAGAFLAREHPVEADVVFGVPDSGLDAALGYSRESGIPYGIGFIKNRYIGRSFIQPTQGQREDAVRIKLNAVTQTVKDKRVVMIDDSIVRGTTSARIVRLLREAGAKEVHMRISSPPFVRPCYFGVDIDSEDKLVASRLSCDEIRRQIGVDSLGYLSLDGVRNIAKGAGCGFCDGCFTGEYPIMPPAADDENKFERKLSGTV